MIGVRIAFGVLAVVAVLLILLSMATGAAACWWKWQRVSRTWRKRRDELRLSIGRRPRRRQ